MPFLELHCEHVNHSAVHCNRYKNVRVRDMDLSVEEIINSTTWGVVDGEVRCHDHI